MSFLAQSVTWSDFDNVCIPYEISQLIYPKFNNSPKMPCIYSSISAHKMCKLERIIINGVIPTYCITGNIGGFGGWGRDRQYELYANIRTRNLTTPDITSSTFMRAR